MHDGIDHARPEQMVKVRAIRQLAHYQLRVFRHCLAMAAAQVIEDDNVVSGLQQLAGHHAADVARSSCNQNFHSFRHHARTASVGNGGKERRVHQGLELLVVAFEMELQV